MSCTSMSISAITTTTPTFSGRRYHRETSPVSCSDSSSCSSMASSPSPHTTPSLYPSHPTSFVPRHPLGGWPQPASVVDPNRYHRTSPPPLTHQERRVRNKAASAKYRQKKNQQQSEIQRMMYHITEQNAILDRQLQELRAENDRLQKTTDHMRAKLAARKMLRQWIMKESQPLPSSKHRRDSAFHPAVDMTQQQRIGGGVQDDLDLSYLDDEEEEEL